MRVMNYSRLPRGATENVPEPDSNVVVGLWETVMHSQTIFDFSDDAPSVKKNGNVFPNTEVLSVI